MRYAIYFDTSSNFHPYECDRAAGGCVQLTPNLEAM